MARAPETTMLKKTVSKKKRTLTFSESGDSPSHKENGANSASATIQDVLAAISTLSAVVYSNRVDFLHSSTQVVFFLDFCTFLSI